MASFETRQSVQEIADIPEDQESFNQLKEEIKASLFSIDENANRLEKRLTILEFLLDDIGAKLEKLKKMKSNAPDIFLFEKLYSDLRSDFEKIKNDGASDALRLNSAYDELVSDMKKTVSEAGVRRESPNKTILAKIVEKLKSLGINPEYIVTKGKKNAHTIVLFKQLHSNPGLAPDELTAIGVSDSQSEIKNAITSALKSGLTDTVYAEGLPPGMPVDNEIAQNILSNIHRDAVMEAKIEHGNKIKIVGYEEMSAFAKTIKAMDRDEEGEVGGEVEKSDNYRATAQNVLIASNISSLSNESDSTISIMTLGGLHEYDSKNQKDNPLPISDALAYYGINVIVVDATEHFNLDAATKIFKKRKSKLLAKNTSK
ncbi:hypothetical protein JW758_02630 [Candidatus Peregrinibacteria bacterium]|nr:hypothetical protein [Candidatus Peregrinibacteria bacterium]